ncbi:hypothetical protein MIR68_001644 [Amoeboaphelidium protococcarum]|nr:hypothetical protein MIR68_001644 [Amoeboaphelidium protococcarum]
MADYQSDNDGTRPQDLTLDQRLDADENRRNMLAMQDLNIEQELGLLQQRPKKVRKPQPKLTAEMLKGPNGLLKLKQQGRHIQFKGKGFESDDLGKLLMFYRVWANDLMPAVKFDKFVHDASQLCHSKEMKAYLDGLISHERFGTIEVGMEQDEDQVGESFGDVNNQSQDVDELQLMQQQTLALIEQRKREREELDNVASQHTGDIEVEEQPIPPSDDDEEIDFPVFKFQPEPSQD